MEKTIIAAVARNGVIGCKGKMPWDIEENKDMLKEDFSNFVNLTRGKPVIMGHSTYSSILYRNGKPLPKRTNIVLSRNDRLYINVEGVVLCRSLDEAFSVAEQDCALRGVGEVCILGGADIYNQTIDVADRLEITHIDRDYIGDSIFPDIDSKVWKELQRRDNKSQSGIDYSFVTYKRK